MRRAFDQERYDAYVAMGFSKVAAAFVCGAPTTMGEPTTDETGSTVWEVKVQVP